MSLLGIPILLQRGPRLFFSLFLSSLGESAISSEHAGVTSRLTSLYGWGQGQVSSQDSPEGRGPGLAMPCGPHALISLSACLHLWPPPSGPRDSGGQQPICEDTWLSTGGEISFTRAPVIWTVTNEASLVTSTDEQPQAVFFWGSVAPLLMTPTVALTLQLLPWHVSNAGLITRRL